MNVMKLNASATIFCFEADCPECNSHIFYNADDIFANYDVEKAFLLYGQMAICPVCNEKIILGEGEIVIDNK